MSGERVFFLLLNLVVFAYVLHLGGISIFTGTIYSPRQKARAKKRKS